MNIKSWAAKYFKREPILNPVWVHMGYRPGPALLSNEAYKKVGFLYRCVRVLSDCAQQVPVFAASQNKSTGKMEKLPDTHPAAMLLKNPNYEDDFPAIIESIVLNEMLHGEALLEKEAATVGLEPGQQRAPARIWSHPAQWIAKVDVENGQYTKFHMRARGYEKVIPGTQAAFFKILHPDDPWRGLAPLSAAYQAADTYYAANLFNARFFENGAVPSLALSFDKDSRIENLTSEQRERIRAEIQRLHGGIDNAHGVAVLGPGESLKEVGGGLKDMFFQALMQFCRAEILAVYGVPLIMVGEPEGSNRANSTEQIRMFWQNTEIPMIEDIASLFNRKVMRAFGPGIAAVWDYSKVPALQKDMLATTQAVVPLIVNGVLTINEVRADLDKPPVAWGDDWWRPTLTVDTDGNIKDDGTAEPANPNDPSLPKPGEEPEDEDEPQPKKTVTPETARKLLLGWKNAAIMRIHAGAKTPVEAFPINREVAKAVRTYGFHPKVAFDLGQQALTEIAIEWNEKRTADGIADFFDSAIQTVKEREKELARQ